MTGRGRYSRMFPDNSRTSLVVELHSTKRWEQVLNHYHFRAATEDVIKVTFCLIGYRCTTRMFEYGPEWRYCQKLPMEFAQEHCTGRFSVPQDFDRWWEPIRLNEEGQEELLRHGLDDYRLGEDWVDYTRSDGSKTPIRGLFAIFRDFDQYALAKLRF